MKQVLELLLCQMILPYGITMTTPFVPGQTVSWKHLMAGRGTTTKPRSFNEVTNMRWCMAHARMPIGGLENAIIVLLESEDYIFSVIKSTSGTRTIRVWKALVTCKEPKETPGPEVFLPSGPWYKCEEAWQESFSTPFYCWIREEHLEPNLDLKNNEERKMDRLRDLHEKRLRKGISS